MRRKGNQSYSAELKRCAVEEYLSGRGSLHDICVKEKRFNLKRFYRLVHIVGLLAVIRRKRPAYQRSIPEITA